MARKIIQCRPVSEIEISLDGGESILLRFDLLAITELQEMEGGLTELFKQKPAEMCASIMYAAGKNYNDNYDLQKARTIVANMQVADITDIINEFADSMGVEKNVAQEEKAKKLMAQFLMSLK